MIDFHLIYLNSDQPQTCPKCGARTNFFMQISPVSNQEVQIHTCLSPYCQFEFVADYDEEFDKELEELAKLYRI